MRQFFRLAIVNILSNLMVPLASLMDVAFLGHLSDIRYLAGVSLTTVLFNYLYWTFNFLRMGTTGMTAQAAGRQDADAVLLVGLRNGAIALAVGLAILVLQVPIKVVGFAVLSAAPEVKAAGQAFFDASIWSAPATLLNYVLIGWYLGRSQSGKVFLLSAIVNVSNVGLAYLFIVRWGWESAGAGAATALSRTLMATIGIGLACREIDIAQVRRLSGQILNPKALKKSVALNSELMVRTFAMISVFAAFTNIGSTLGATVLSSNAVLLQAIALASYFIDGLAFATESVVGTLSAQGRMRSLIQLLKAAGSTSFLLGLMFALIFIAAPGPIFQLLTNHRDVLSHIDTYTPWLLPVLGFGSIAYFLDGYFIGLTEGRLLRVSALAAASIGFAPVALVAWYLHNNHVLWFGLALFMAIRTITLGVQVPKTLQKAAGIQGQPLKAWE